MPQLRIHLTDRDIARTRMKLETDLMWEIVSSIQILQHTDGDLGRGLVLIHGYFALHHPGG